MIEEVIDIINERLCKCLGQEAKTFGLTQLMRKENYTIPAVIDKNGEGTEVLVNDAFTAIIYHRQQGITGTLLTARPGYGDDMGSLQNTHTMAMFIYFQPGRIKMLHDEIFQAIQGSVSLLIQQFPPFNSVQVLIGGAIVNDVTVWNSEYTANVPNRLPESANLMQINYQIISTFRKDCFKCKDC